jgi:uncharacterized protein (DUF1501 family)
MKNNQGKPPFANAGQSMNGLRRQAGRTNRLTFLAPAAPTGAWAMIPLRQMENELALLLRDYEGWEKEVVYAELLEYARLVTPRYEKTFAETRAIAEAETLLKGEK